MNCHPDPDWWEAKVGVGLLEEVDPHSLNFLGAALKTLTGAIHSADRPMVAIDFPLEATQEMGI